MIITDRIFIGQKKKRGKKNKMKGRTLAISTSNTRTPPPPLMRLKLMALTDAAFNLYVLLMNAARHRKARYLSGWVLKVQGNTTGTEA